MKLHRVVLFLLDLCVGVQEAMDFFRSQLPIALQALQQLQERVGMSVSTNEAQGSCGQFLLVISQWALVISFIQCYMTFMCCTTTVLSHKCMPVLCLCF